MSPLPERLADRTSYTSDDERIRIFFSEEIGPDKIWHLRASLKNFHEEEKLYKSMGIDFKAPPLEDYMTKKKDGSYIFHHVYSTNQKGIYLELKADNSDTLHELPKTLKSIREPVFHRLGKDINEEYIASICNG